MIPILIKGICFVAGMVTGLIIQTYFKAAKDVSLRPKKSYPSATGEVIYMRGQQMGALDENSYS